jgi:hypothetical protein
MTHRHYRSKSFFIMWCATIYPTEQYIQGEDGTLRIKVLPPTFGAQWKRTWPSVFYPKEGPWMLPSLAPQSTDYYPSLHERMGPEPSRTRNSALGSQGATTPCCWVLTLHLAFASSIAIYSRPWQQKERFLWFYALVLCFQLHMTKSCLHNPHCSTVWTIWVS